MAAPFRRDPPPAVDTTTRHIRVLNTSGEQIPPFAALEIVGYDRETSRFLVGKPSITGYNDCVFNDRFTIPDGAGGQALREGEIPALYSATGRDPQPGEIWGTIAGQWYLSPYSTGYVIRKKASNNRAAALVSRAPSTLKQWVRITGAAGSGSGSGSSGESSGSGSSGSTLPTTYYQGIIQKLDVETDEWYDTPVVVWWRDKDGAEPTIGDRIESSHEGNGGTNDDRRPLYVGTIVSNGDDGTSTSSDGDSCAWLNWIKTTPRPCWTFYHKGGVGKCECFPLEDEFDPTAGIVAIYQGAPIDGWLGVKPNSSANSAMMQTCCGCGSGILRISGDTPSFIMGGIHTACPLDSSGSGSGSGSGSSGSSGGETTEAVFTETLTRFKCGVLRDGRRYIDFFGGDPQACSGDEADCANHYKVRAVCGATCPGPACGCVGCNDANAPIAWYALGLSGFPDTRYDGDWVWSYSDESCTWSASCRGGSSTIVFDTVDAVWRLTHGGYVYEAAPGVNDCLGALVFARVSGDGPEAVTVSPVIPTTDSEPAECCNPPDTLYATSAFFGTTTTLVKTDPRTWTQVDTTTCGDGPTYDTNVLQKDASLCLFTITPHASCCGASGSARPISTNPFILVITGSGGGIPGCPDTDTVTVTEDPP